MKLQHVKLIFKNLVKLLRAINSLQQFHEFDAVYNQVTVTEGNLAIVLSLIIINLKWLGRLPKI